MQAAGRFSRRLSDHDDVGWSEPMQRAPSPGSSRRGAMRGRVMAFAAPKASATKTRILDVAEALFMEHGFEATTLRQITAAAEVNLAAAHYHFGSKEELFEAVLRRRLDPMNQERLSLLTRFDDES